MEIVIKRYSGETTNELLDVMEKRLIDVEHVMRSVKGFISYTLARNGDGGFTVTVCENKAGIDESIQKTRDWIAKNVAKSGAASPKVTIGTAILHIKSSTLEHGAFQELQTLNAIPE